MKFVSRSIVEQDKELPNSDAEKEQDSSEPQQEYDPRTLYERLQEQRTIKEEQFQEASRLSNLIKRVDDEEAEYFQSLLDVQEKLELEQRQKEKDEIAAYRKAVEQTRQTTSSSAELTAPGSAAKKQPVHQRRASGSSAKKSLSGLVIVKKKRSANDDASEDEDKEGDSALHAAKKAKISIASSKDTPSQVTDGSNSGTSASTVTNTSKPASTTNTLSSLMAAYSSDSSDDE